MRVIYKSHSAELRGLQFFKVFLNLPALGMHVMVPIVIRSLRQPRSYASWYALNSQVLSSSLKNLKNSLVYPSGPGALLSLLLFMECSNSAILKGNFKLSLGDLVAWVSYAIKERMYCFLILQCFCWKKVPDRNLFASLKFVPGW